MRSTVPAPSASAVLPGTTFAGRYHIERQIGRGGMGAVYKAHLLKSLESVAIKILHAHLAFEKIALARFQREAEVAASVGHEHVVEVLDTGFGPGGAPYIVMEYVEGPSISTVLRTEGPFAWRRASDIGGQILRALAAVHAQGVIHRDLKPGNVLLATVHDRADFVKLFDFGIATFFDRMGELTPVGRSMGTPEYCSPEQIRGLTGSGPRTDLYAVGVMLYEMLAGHPPFVADDLPSLSQKILAEDPPPICAFRKDVPGDLEHFVRRALEKTPERRFDDAASMAAELSLLATP